MVCLLLHSTGGSDKVHSVSKYLHVNASVLECDMFVSMTTDKETSSFWLLQCINY